MQSRPRLPSHPLNDDPQCKRRVGGQSSDAGGEPTSSSVFECLDLAPRVEHSIGAGLTLSSALEEDSVRGSYGRNLDLLRQKQARKSRITHQAPRNSNPHKSVIVRDDPQNGPSSRMERKGKAYGGVRRSGAPLGPWTWRAEECCRCLELLRISWQAPVAPLRKGSSSGRTLAILELRGPLRMRMPQGPRVLLTDSRPSALLLTRTGPAEISQHPSPFFSAGSSERGRHGTADRRTGVSARRCFDYPRRSEPHIAGVLLR